MSSRSDKDYAIEHGEYLANAAENFQRMVNETMRQMDEGEAIDQDYLTEAWERLNNAIGGFRRRAYQARDKVPRRIDYLKITRELVGGI